MVKKSFWTAGLAVLLFVMAGAGVYVYQTIKAVPAMFKQNEELKSQGYYMAEFEFKMMGCAYYLDRGNYITALSRLRQVQYQLKTREGLIKIPAFTSTGEELDFYLNLQNPRTGAFMDENYPLITYIGPTANVISHIKHLCQQSNRPLQLKYPLSFLDQISSPEALKTMLDSVSTVGALGAKFRPTYVLTAEINYYEDDIEGMGLYKFSPEWKKALRQWYYDHQDPATGYWGPRLQSSGELLDGGDLVSTEKVLQLFLDKEGKNRNQAFPLQHRSELFNTTLQKLKTPMPHDLSEIHDWNLVMNRGTRILTRYLWSEADPQATKEAEKIIQQIVADKFEKTYIAAEGAFSYYPGAASADLDGTGENLAYLREVGFFSGERQQLLWGFSGQEIVDLGRIPYKKSGGLALDAFNGIAGLNSIRLYNGDPGPDYMDHLVCIVYPREPQVLDAVDLIFHLRQWAEKTPQAMGNWVSKESVREKLNLYRPVHPAVYRGAVPQLNEMLKSNGQLRVLAFDTLQRPLAQSIWVYEA